MSFCVWHSNDDELESLLVSSREIELSEDSICTICDDDDEAEDDDAWKSKRPVDLFCDDNDKAEDDDAEESKRPIDFFAMMIMKLKMIMLKKKMKNLIQNDQHFVSWYALLFQNK